KLAELEREEEKLAAEGLYDSPEDETDDEDRRIRDLARRIRERKQIIAQESRVNNNGRSTLTHKQRAAAGLSGPEDFAAHLRNLGLDGDAAHATAERVTRKRDRSVSQAPAAVSLARRSASLAARAISVQRDRSTMGLRDASQAAASARVHTRALRIMGSKGRAGEADRKIQTKMPRHLFSGKRGIGTANHR
ncbi:Nucleolar GTP-binding protein 1, partial [Coemansia helicoidea]